MELTKRLVMSFKTALDRKVSFSIEDPRADLTESEIKAVMDLIVAKNIFAPSGADIIEAIDAKIVETSTTDYDLVIG